jgi:hypothetical protein
MAYFRSADEEEDTAAEGTTPEMRDSAPPRDAPDGSARAGNDIQASVDAVIELLAEAGVMPEQPRRYSEPHTRTREPRNSLS